MRMIFYGSFIELPLRSISPQGWLKTFLLNQRNGLTGHLDSCGYPFNAPGWISSEIQAPADKSGWEYWYAYEQHAYWLDGMVRAGYLLNDEFLIGKALPQISYVLDNPGHDGYLGPEPIKAEKTNNRWPHAVLFRAIWAHYSATSDSSIIDKLLAHYRSNTSTHSLFRDACNIETMLRVYHVTGDHELLTMAQEAFARYNVAYKHTDMSMSSLASDKVATEHGVSFNEIGKLGAILFSYTGNTDYLNPVLNGYEKINRDHLLASGVCSSEERLSGKDPLRCYEICDITDFTWSLGYLLFASGNAAYADQIEKACFNALPGSVTKDFKASQYFSCANQIIADHQSSHTVYRKGNSRMSFRPNHIPACCSSNISRAMPNYISRMWLNDAQGNITAALYGPSVITFSPPDQGVTVTIEEQTGYPFSEQIDFKFRTPYPCTFTFKFRVPSWCSEAKWHVNGVEQSQKLMAGSFHSVEREFNNGDVITLLLPMELKLTRWPQGGIALEAGPLLFSLPIQEIRHIDTAEKLCTAQLPAFNMYPNSPWNYAICLDEESVRNILIKTGSVSDAPWSADSPPLYIEVPARQVHGWDMHKCTDIKMHLPCAGDLDTGIEIASRKGNFNFTPDLPDAAFLKAKLSNDIEIIKLVPYGCTLLRMTVFPDGNIR